MDLAAAAAEIKADGSLSQDDKDELCALLMCHQGWLGALTPGDVVRLVRRAAQVQQSQAGTALPLATHLGFAEAKDDRGRNRASAGESNSACKFSYSYGCALGSNQSAKPIRRCKVPS